jgi:hypothetical protein
MVHQSKGLDRRRIEALRDTEGSQEASIAGRLLFSLQFSLCLFGRFARCLIGGRPRGVGCCLRCNLSLLCEFALLALPGFFTLHCALASRSGGLARNP